MKCKLLIIFFITIFSNINLATAEILPEIEKNLLLKLPDNTQQNAFLGLVAIESPINTDPIEVGKIFISKFVRNYNEAIKNKNSNLLPRIDIYSDFTNQQLISLHDNYEYYSLPCNLETDKDCINKLIKTKAKTIPFIKHNKLLKRYKVYIRLPIYESIQDADIAINAGGNYIRLSHLHLKEAIYAITDNQINEGLDILQSEIDFAKRVLSQNKNLTIAEHGMFNIGLRRTYALISQLLDRPELISQLNNPKLKRLLKSFTDTEQQAFATAIINDRNQELRSLYIRPDEVISSRIINNVPAHEIIVFFLPNTDDLAFNMDKTMNSLYITMNDAKQKAKLVLPSASEYYQKILQPKLNKQTSILVPLFNKYGIDNIVGRFYVQNKVNFLSSRLLTQYDLVSYLHLIQVKLKIKQAQISKDNIPHFLQQLGDKALNLYSKQPIVWNSKDQTLSYNWLNMIHNKSSDKMFVYLE